MAYTKEKRREYLRNWRKAHPTYSRDWTRRKRLQQAKDYWRDREQRIKDGAVYRESTDRWEILDEKLSGSASFAGIDARRYR